MLKIFLAEKLKQTSAWIGIALMIGAFLFPPSFIALLGVALILNDDTKLKELCARLRENLEKWWG